MLNFVICDDDENMINKLSTLLNKCFLKNDFDAKIVFMTTDYKELLSYTSSNIINVVILDIEFKGSKLNGLQIAEKIRKVNKDCYIIFTTSHFEYVMQAYNCKTFAYLIKNSISVDTLTETLTRLFDDVTNSSSKFLKISNNGTIIDLNDVQFIEKRGMKLIYHTSHDIFETYNSFTKLALSLPDNFVRCHKSFIANINNIVDLSLSDGSITFKNGSVCYIGPKYKDCFMEVIEYDTITK